METKREFNTWREMLGFLTKNPPEKQRLAHEADVSVITLRRWVTGESNPREDNLRQLVGAISSEFVAQFRRLLEVDYPLIAREELVRGRIVPEVSADLYAQVMRVYAKTPSILAGDTLYKLIFERALEHLDPDKLGLSLALVCCVHPLPGHKVRSLRQVRGLGTPPFERELERKTMFLGSESVAGHAVMNYRLAIVESRDSTSFTSANWTDYEESAIASPILRQARVVGALLASSAIPHYFTPAHQALLELYSPLAGLMFDSSEFYDPMDIMLGVMPAFDQQIPLFANFEQRVALKMTSRSQGKNTITIQQAHQLVWHDISEELLQVSSSL
ncbi:MAG TPA: GAF domain-containing protein [Ktedonobacteraceae bacterium]